jgi:hypothetical protein
VKTLQLIFERGIGSIQDLPERWMMAAGVVIVLVALAIALLTIARIRLSRKLKAIDAVVAELQGEVDRLRQAEERRALSDLRANRNFLQNLALELADNNPAKTNEASQPAENLGTSREPARLKLSSAG